MAPSTHLAISLVLVIVTAVALPDVLYAHGNAKAKEDCALSKRGALPNACGIKQTTDGIEEAYAKEVIQTIDIAIEAFVTAIQLFANMPQPCVVDNAWASRIKQESVIAAGAFANVIELLVSPESCGLKKNYKIDKERESALEKSTAESIRTFRHVITQLVTFYLGGNKKGTTNNEWASGVKKTVNTVTGYYAKVLKGLLKCSAVHDKWANAVLQPVDIGVGFYRILIDELLLSQYTGIANYLTADQANELLQSTDIHVRSLRNVIAQHVALITGENLNA